MASVTCVYVWSACVQDLPGLMRKALEKNGDGDKIKVETIPIKMVDDTAQLSEEGIKQIPLMEYLYTDPSIIIEVFRHPESRIKWVQLALAGCDTVLPELKKIEKKADFIITRREAGFPEMMSEYVLGHIIARERYFTQTYEYQKLSSFTKKSVRGYRLLQDLTVGIIGLGVIGSEVARVCKAMKMTVLGIIRNERYEAGDTQLEHIDLVRPLSEMSKVLESCDYLVSILPSIPQTNNLLSGDVFQPCQAKKTVFINVGRGNVIDDDSLVNAIKNGWLGGAILDVFNEEPLPSTSPLWTLPGVTITPHISAICTPGLATDCFIHNLNAYRAGIPMKNVVDYAKGY